MAIDIRRTFYLTTIPGLESVTHLELCEKWGRAAAFLNLPPFPEVTFHRGGMEFDAPVGFGLFLNSWLRTNTRMLLRISGFEAPNEKTFVKALESIPWDDYFAKGGTFDFKFTSKSSKLSMTYQIENCLSQALKKHKVKYKKGGTTLYVRMFRDQCNISLDATGEAAFKRGEGQKASIASLRPSTAQGLLRVLVQGLTDSHALVDPMCGSGTFLQEALKWNQPLHRDFAFQNIPMVQDFKSNLEELSQRLAQTEGKPIGRVFGFDQNEKAVALARKNFTPFAPDRWQVAVDDLFANKAPSDVKNPLVILNPPWGKRLPGVSEDIMQAVWSKYKPLRLGLLMPVYWKLSPIPMQKVRDLPLLTSGVETRFLLFAR